MALGLILYIGGQAMFRDKLLKSKKYAKQLKGI